MSTYKALAVVGGGAIGIPIVNALAERTHLSVYLLTRPGSSPKNVPSGVEIIPVDYTNTSAVAAVFKQHSIDVVLSTVNNAGLAAQKALVDAAKLTGVKLFLPSEYGAPTDRQPDGVNNPIGGLGAKNQTAAYLKSVGLPSTKIFTGLFTEYIPWLVGFPEHGKFKIVGKGDAQASFTSIADVAGFVAYILTSFPPSEVEDRIFRLEGDRASLRDLAVRFNTTMEHVSRIEGEEGEAKTAVSVILSSGAGSTGWDAITEADRSGDEAAGSGNKMPCYKPLIILKLAHGRSNIDATDLTPAATRHRIADIDTEIAALDESIHKLRLQQASLKSHLDAYVYPVLDLPHEIVSEVFLQTISASTPSRLKAPLLLGQICHTWREIALSTPALWADLNIDVRGTNDLARVNKLRLLELWLIRSRDCPLHLTISSRPPPDASDDCSIAEFIYAIVPHCARWKTLFLTLPFCDLSLITGEMPILCFLALTIMDMDEMSSTPVQVFDRAPKLVSFLVCGALNPNLVVFPWAQIELFCIYTDFIDAILEILVPLVNITQLVIGIRSSGSHPEFMIDTVTAPDIPSMVHLRAVFLQSRHPTNSIAAEQLLEKLMIPKLVHLRITTPSLSPRVIASLLSRSHCHLPSLRIEINESKFSEEYHRSILPVVGSMVFSKRDVEEEDTDLSFETEQESDDDLSDLEDEDLDEENSSVEHSGGEDSGEEEETPGEEDLSEEEWEEDD
ncbi:NmrA domain-containing protein [Mycena venus]|uniref:NmrA domain-containing protein n=1 Tax=Mycena venus TaxID=2733690 RepID=A0A8H6X5R0_9AGAR|nr:NmrA domain-containing protein [Mycena venus]